MTSQPERPRVTALVSPLLQAVNLVIVAASGAWFATVRPTLPETVPVHWDGAGNPNRFGSPNELFIFAGFGVLATLIVWTIAWFVARKPYDVSGVLADRIAAARDAMLEERRVGVRMMEMMLFGMNAALSAMAFVAVDAARRTDGSNIADAVLVLFVVVPVLVVAPLVYAVRRGRVARAKILEASGKDASSDGWLAGGLVYYAPDDPRLLVPKRMGIGGTFNFAHRTAWIVLVLLLAPPLVIAAALAALSLQ